MTPGEQYLADSLRPCPHCGKPPTVTVISYRDERSLELDTEWLTCVYMGQHYYRIECCAMIEGTDWSELSPRWNRRLSP